MGPAVAGLVRCFAEKLFVHRLAGEHRVPGVDAGIEDADRDTAKRAQRTRAWIGVFTGAELSRVPSPSSGTGRRINPLIPLEYKRSTTHAEQQ